MTKGQPAPMPIGADADRTGGSIPPTGANDRRGVLAQYGGFKVIEKERVKTGSANGLRIGWREYQVRQGRRVVARHELFGKAMADAKERNQKLWAEIGEQLKQEEKSDRELRRRRAIEGDVS